MFEHHVAKALMPDQCDLDFGQIMKEVARLAKLGSFALDDEAVPPTVLAAEWVDAAPFDEFERVYIRQVLAAMLTYTANEQETSDEQELWNAIVDRKVQRLVAEKRGEE